jgi:hypothetical protein
MQDYLKSQSKTDQGIDRLVNAFKSTIKTLRQEGLTEAEIEQQIAAGKLQGLVGQVRTSVGGPGVMTEGDVGRILAYLGGNVSALQNPAVVKQAIEDAMINTYREYIDELPNYQYLINSQFGKYKPMDPIELSTEMQARLIAEGLE